MFFIFSSLSKNFHEFCLPCIEKQSSFLALCSDPINQLLEFWKGICNQCYVIGIFKISYCSSSNGDVSNIPFQCISFDTFRVQVEEVAVIKCILGELLGQFQTSLLSIGCTYSVIVYLPSPNMGCSETIYLIVRHSCLLCGKQNILLSLSWFVSWYIVRHNLH